MRPKEIRELLIKLAPSSGQAGNICVHIWGSPGVGKSSLVKQVAADLGGGLIDVRATLLDPSDIRGIPVPQTDGTARWYPPSFLPNAERDGDTGILFLDELNAAPPLTQASCYQLVLDRQVGEYVLPDGWMIIAAGNRQGDRAVVHRMPSPLANRFIHVDFEPTLDDWTDWAFAAKINPLVIGFIQFRGGELLNAFDPKRDERAFPTPRSWAFVSSLIGLPRHILSAAVAGAVGDGAAAEFMSYLEVSSQLPDVDAILNGGRTIPTRKDLKYALVVAIASKCEEKHVDHVIKYSMAYPEAEFPVLMVKLMSSRLRSAVTKSPSYRDWIAKYRDLIVAD